jgi:hypothetical protein
MSTPTDNSKPVKERVEGWLAKEGYPLEFSVAKTFRAAGFHVRQGEYVRGEDPEQPREIDVAATISTHGESLSCAYISLSSASGRRTNRGLCSLVTGKWLLLL